ncbi:MAG: ERAP1-like C-terminal domain-containing protein [Betaproteobacteria bacterium]|nr:ERAP1-like C-terminal domain-containing protein [Betaproteobacteria bacterium]
MAIALALLAQVLGVSTTEAAVGQSLVRPAGMLEPGVSRDLARWRAANYRDVRYALSLDLTAGAETISGKLEARVRLPKTVDLVLDWRPSGPLAQVSEIRVNGNAAIGIRREHEHLVIPRRLLVRGENLVQLSFAAAISASGAALTRYRDREDGSEYLYTLLVPSEASTLFPCFDQPDLKARFRLDVAAPPNWKVIANAPLEQSTAETGAQRHRFRETGPISTYLFAFAAGPFEAISDPSSALATRMYVRATRAERARRESGEVLRLNREGIGYLEDYFARDFPFPKYDLVLIPEFAYGGMEHAGATFLREESILFPSEPSANDRLRRAQLLLHEASHQWFGNLVTMRWFDDLWLKEGFANFMATKAAEVLLPQHDVWNAFHALKTSAYRTDATLGTTAIRQPLENLADAKSAYGNIVYGKAPAILRQAEFYIGETAFRQGVRDLVRRYALKSADWNDLVRTLERASGRSLGGWATAWVNRRGMPRLRLERREDRHGRMRAIAIAQEDVLGSRAVWPMRIRLLAALDDERTVEVSLRGRRTEVVGFAGAPAPQFLYANEGDYGYGQFLLDEASRAAVLERPEIVRGALRRTLVFDSLWESTREAELAPREFIGLVLRVARQETDEVTLAALLARSHYAATRYLSEEQLREIAPLLEQLYFDGMTTTGELATGPSRRIAFLRAFMGSGWTQEARTRLKALLAGRITVQGVPLGSRDRFHIVGTLLARGDPEAAALLSAQAASDPSDDGRRYAFAAAAASADQAAKERYFERFLGDASLAESWIAESLAPFNAVEHARLTAPFLPRALAALPELKRVRRIFFVNEWLAAFLGGQTGIDSLRLAQRFLESANLERDLRLKLLEAMDALERVVRIRGKYAGKS